MSRATRTHSYLARIALLCAVMSPVAAKAQLVAVHDEADSSTPVVREFLEQARLAAEGYRDPDAATLAGYRLLGPDFPGMGHHWINNRYLREGTVDPGKPPVLTYLQVEGKLVLTGVAFAVAVQSKDDLPAFPSPGAWHTHHGTVDEETLIFNPASGRHGNTNGWKLAMLHAWIFVENPAGVFAQNNWTLPFYRTGMAPPKHVTPQQAKALHLVSGGEAYYLRLIETARPLQDSHRASVARVLRKHAQEVRDLLGRQEPRAVPTESFTAQLESIWLELWRDIKAVIPEDDWSEIKMLSG